MTIFISIYCIICWAGVFTFIIISMLYITIVRISSIAIVISSLCYIELGVFTIIHMTSFHIYMYPYINTPYVIPDRPSRKTRIFTFSSVLDLVKMWPTRWLASLPFVFVVHSHPHTPTSPCPVPVLLCMVLGVGALGGICYVSICSVEMDC